jgi:hypothetical protein
MSIASQEIVLLWRQVDGMWRWSWSLRDEDGLEQQSLISNEAFDSRSEALSSAREAYPGVEILEVDGDQPPPPAKPRRLTTIGVLATIAGIAVIRRRRRGTSVG